MTPRMFVAALVQYSSSNTSLSTNLRFRWEYQPGSELFVVYTEGRTTLPRAAPTSRTAGSSSRSTVCFASRGDGAHDAENVVK